MKSGKLVVRPHSPWRMRIILGGGALVLLLAGMGLYFLGELQAGYNQVAAAEERKRLQDIVRMVEREKSELRDKIALLERSNQVDRQAYSEVDNNLKALQEEILELREEVSFYRGIVSPSESSAGLRIERFRIVPESEEGLYHYNLVLTQVLKNDRVARGRVKVFVEGVEDGQPKRYSLEDLSPQNSSAMAFRYRYFQKFEGDIKIPQGFLPRSVEVEVAPFRRKNFSRNFDWPTNLDPEAATAES